MNKKVSVYNYIINLDGDYRSLFDEVEQIAIEAICLLTDKQEQKLVEILAEEYDIKIEDN
jgi:hypothetical protein